jgi:glycosyltransferase involved in cell wall biosynthesis
VPASPSVGVFVPSYNAEDFLGDCLESLLEQTYPVDQIVVCDDASTDDTPSIIRDYASRYPDRVSGILHGENLGIPANFNSGLAAMETDLVSLIAGDDCWHPEKVEYEVDRLQSAPSARWVYSRSRRIDESGNDIGAFDRKYDGRDGDILYEVLTHRMALRNYLAERSLFDEVGGFDEAFEIFEDWDLKIRLSAHAPITFVDRETVYYRSKAGKGASSSSPQIYVCNLERVYGKHANLIDAMPPSEKVEILDNMSNDLLHQYRNWGHRSLREGNLSRAFKCYTRVVAHTRSLHLKMLARILLHPVRYPSDFT